MKRFLVAFVFMTLLLSPIFDVLSTANGEDEDFALNFGDKSQKAPRPCIVTKNEKEYASTSSKGKVLIVDDNRSIQMTMVKILKAAGYNIETAHNGLDAIEKCKSEKFNFILMDIEMPKMDGKEASQKIHDEIGLNHKTPIIATTSVDMSENYAEYNMNAYVAKPVRKKELLLAIDKVLPNNKQNSSIEKSFQCLRVEGENNP